MIKVGDVKFFFDDTAPPTKLPNESLGEENRIGALSVLPNAMEHNKGSRCIPAIIGESPLTTWKR